MSGRRGPLSKDAAADLPANVTRLRDDVNHSGSESSRHKLRPGRPSKPRGQLDDYGRKIWDLVCEELEPFGLLSPVDGPILEAFAKAAQHARDARKLLDTEGLTFEGQKGDMVKNPAWQIYREAVGMVNELGTKLALNPSARLRILHDLEGLGAEDEDDLLD